MTELAVSVRTVGHAEVLGSCRLRPVGGGPLDGARLFRSAELWGMACDEEDAISGRFGIGLVCDLRTPHETALHPAPALGGVRVISAAASDCRRRKDAAQRLVAGVIGEYGAPGERMERNYRRYVTKYPAIGEALRAAACSDAPVLIHCVNGKDRSGVASAVATRLAGFHPDDVMADYLLANEVNADLVEAEVAELSCGMTDEELEVLRSFVEARPEYLCAFFDEADAAYGSFDAYVRDGLGLDARMRDAIADLF